MANPKRTREAKEMLKEGVQAPRKLEDFASFRSLPNGNYKGSGLLYFTEHNKIRMFSESLLPYEKACSLFIYDPEISKALLWAKNLGSRARRGMPTGTMGSNGYWRTKHEKHFYSNHRIVYLLHHKRWPASGLDHIDGDRLNNRIENLRDCIESDNNINKAMRSDNKSGYLGVSWDKRSNKWDARIMRFGRQKCLGLFPTAQEAHEAYCAAAEIIHNEFRRQDLMRGNK